MSFDEETQRLTDIGEKADVRWNTDREAILDAVNGDTWMTREEVKAEVSISNSDLGKHLSYLVEKKWLTTMKGGESGKKTLYRLVDQRFYDSTPIPESQNRRKKEEEAVWTPW